MGFPAVFAIVVGLGMIGQWTMSYAAKQIPELQTEPYRIGFHITGEMTTAILLLVAGVSLLLLTPWAPAVYLIAMGMLFYTAVVSPGYFAQKGQWVWVLIFGVLIILAIICVVMVGSGISL